MNKEIIELEFANAELQVANDDLIQLVVNMNKQLDFLDAA